MRFLRYPSGQTNRQTDRQTDMLFAILLAPTGGELKTCQRSVQIFKFQRDVLLKKNNKITLILCFLL